MVATFRPCNAVIGAEVENLSLGSVPSETEIAAIENGLEKFGVLIFRRQHISVEQQITFTKAFGPLTKPQIKTSNPGETDEILRVGNTGKTLVTFSPASSDGNLEWHSDSIHRQVPARASLLYALKVPEQGGDTLFACMYSAYDRLSSVQKENYNSLKVVNSVSGVQVWLENQGYASKSSSQGSPTEDYAIHPLVRTHPVSGRKALYFGNQVSVAIVDWEREKSSRFIEKLTRHSCAKAFQYRHRWRVGDALFWDNRRILHAGTAYDIQNEKRLLHRTTLRETVPISCDENI